MARPRGYLLSVRKVDAKESEGSGFVIGVSVTFRYDGDFDRARVVRVADNARAMFEGMPGLRFKFFTFDEKQQRATNFYVWDSQEVAEQFFTERTAGTSDQPLRGDALYRLRGDRTDRGQLGLVAQEVTPTTATPAGSAPRRWLPPMWAHRPYVGIDPKARGRSRNGHMSALGLSPISSNAR